MLIGWMLALQLAAAPVAELAPGATYDPRIPTITQVLGHEFGDKITTPEEIPIYLRALHQAAPDRTRLTQYARSWEGRPLWLFVIASPERIAALDALKGDLRRLADPRSLSATDADRLVRTLPVVTWLMHGVHGDEISSSDAALAEAYHLLAAQRDPDVDLVLQQSVVVIDPMQNPDGRARFIVNNLFGGAASPDPTPAAAEHDEPWPGGRSNHYVFDMNRDWFSQSQPETRGRVAAMLEWFPHVVVDLHEMGGDSSYYFAPPAHPINPHVTQAHTASFELFGRANAARFDERGFAYFVRENYDEFYPGYGESWPIFHGAIGMTYEQASPRGLIWKRRDGDLLTYRDAIVRHFTAALATAVTAATHRERLLRDFLDYRRTAVSEGERGPVRECIIVPGHDRSRARLLARSLATQGIEVRRAEEGIRAGGRSIEAGAYVVSNAQPSGRLIRNLLDPHTAPDVIDRARREAYTVQREVLMNGRRLGIAAAAAGVSAIVALSVAPVAGQSKSAIPRDPHGRPDLQGIWAYATVTPLERPQALAGKATFATDEELAEFERSTVQGRNQDRRDGAGTNADVSRAYNDFWWDRGTRVLGRQTSLVVDPPDGRVPALTPEAQQRQTARTEARRQITTDADNPEDRSLWERCITRALPMLPGAYNNNDKIVQTKDHVMLMQEMIHEARVIPTDGRPHSKVRQWHGSSRGRWEGDTLVIETINFTDKTNFRGAGQNLKLIERISRPDADTLLYRVTIEDPTTFTQPWTVQMPMVRSEEDVYEYACHEGNRGLEGIMTGSRLQDRLRVTGGER